MPETLILYTREGCQLCREAAGLVASAGAEVREVDIGGDLGLLERYHAIIPVLRNPRTGRELGWPFAGNEITELLSRS